MRDVSKGGGGSPEERPYDVSRGQNRYVTVAKSARLLVMQIQIFSVHKPYNESISREMNNDNDLNLQSMTKLSGWLRYCM